MVFADRDVSNNDLFLPYKYFDSTLGRRTTAFHAAEVFESLNTDHRLKAKQT